MKRMMEIQEIQQQFHYDCFVFRHEKLVNGLLLFFELFNLYEFEYVDLRVTINIVIIFRNIFKDLTVVDFFFLFCTI